MSLVFVGIVMALVIMAIEGNAKQAAAEKRVIGYFWSSGSGSKTHYTTARKNADVLTHLCPTRVAIADTDGNVKYGKDNWLIAFGKREGIAILPLVANKGFSREIAHAVLSDPAKRTKVINQLLDVVQEWRSPGINIDIENVEAADRERLNLFMEELCRTFHGKGLAVTIDVPAKTRDAPESYWAGAFDYRFLGRHCDLVLLMCYDEHWSSGKPGPIASKPWVRKCLEYATSVIPRHKVVLGVPFYGYDWPEEGRAKAYTTKGVTELAAEKKPKLRWDNTAKYHWFRYKDDTGRREVWYEDPSSLAHKIALAQEFDVAGISIWRLGDEDPEYWNLLAKYREGEKCIK